jgi:hypothetical protein
MWRAMFAESLVMAPIRRLARSGGRSPENRGAKADEYLIHLAGESLPFRALVHAGELVRVAWRNSFSGASLAQWRAVAPDRRVRLTAIVLLIASMTHIGVTRFRAPEPVLAARLAWIAVLTILAAVAVEARGVAAAWAAWTGRRRGAPEIL